ncbi:polyprenyl synthetase [Ancylostoma caninum]|uniref:Farnesyl pyrophosphate synthase n=1 Tax=Ancylostoma caninum TaxID=29170 RepID=A0A368GCE4_ANCCA|nr:polyprenyl synthetase [Ancylostoma caninum]
MQAAKKLASKNLIEVALLNVRRRFLDLTSRQFAPDSFEHDLVKYRSKGIFDGTVTGGKNLRALLALESFQALNPEAGTAEVHRMAECASLLEMIQSFYLIVDDIMDGAETRRGKPCWYKVPGVGLGAVNDALLLDVFVEDIIRELYPGHPQVERLCDAYRKSKRITLLGQLLDTASVGDVNAFTWDRYEQLVAFKTSHYSYFHPVEMAMLVSDRLDNHPILRQLAYRIGFLFQSQDDVLDVFGDPNVTGKIGTDIQDGKCTWISVRAVQKLHGKSELNEFKNHYGKTDPESVRRIKVLIEHLKLREEFINFEKRYSDKVKADIDRVPERLSVMKPVLHQALNKLIDRSK